MAENAAGKRLIFQDMPSFTSQTPDKMQAGVDTFLRYCPPNMEAVQMGPGIAVWFPKDWATNPPEIDMEPILKILNRKEV